MAVAPAENRSLGHYRLLEKIGSGGMGEVYLAHDEVLDRQVAVKILHEDGANNGPCDTPGRSALQKEARALSRLNHPNIATIYDFVHEADVDFIVMEYIAGESLATMLKRGPISQDQLLDIALQTAEGLDAAHARGLVHRDLKPANIQVTPEGRVKILDFGLAQLTHPVDVHASTQTVDEASLGITGTLAYMSPEQLRGEVADTRSDLWSLGVVLYEMATGKLPFRGKTASELAGAILHEPVPAMTGAVSPGVARVIGRCLQKESDKRYRTVQEFLADLRVVERGGEPRRRRGAAVHWPWWIGLCIVAALIAGGFVYWSWQASRPANSGINSVAVLPLANLSHDASQDYFSEGMTDAIINELSRASTLKVISRTSVMRYNGTNTPVEEIARQLHVDGVIEGSVYRQRDQVRINVRLIDAATGTQVWADSFERDMGDVLALQGEIAHAIMRQLRVRLGGADGWPQSAKVNPAAYDALLKARFYTYRVTPADNAKAEQFAREAIGLQPDMGDAYHILSEILWFQAMALGFPTVEEARKLLDESLAASEKAIALGANAHPTYALLRFSLDHDTNAAEAEYKRGIELQPNKSSAHGHYGVFLALVGRCDEARNELLRAVELDPTGEFAISIAGEFLMYCRDLRSGEQYLRAALDIDPNYERARNLLELDYLLQHKTQEILDGVARSGRSEEEKAEIRQVLARGGEAGFRRWSAQLMLNDPQQNQRAFNRASAYAFAGEREKALENLRQANAQGDPRIMWVRAYPQFWSLWGDGEYNALLNKIGLPETVKIP